MRCTALVAFVAMAACLSRPTGSPHPCADVAAGHTHSCAIDGPGRVWCWGRGVLGMANGHDLAESFVTPTLVALPSGDPALQLAAGDTFTCARVASGRVYCWGEGTSGQLGDGQLVSEGVVEVQLGGETAIELAAGGQFACIRRARDSAVMCWGANDCHQVSPDPTGAFGLPTLVAGSEGAASIGLGHKSACWVGADGSLQCWGKSKHSALGDPVGANSPRDQPMPTVAFDPVSRVAPGGQFTCGLETAQSAVRCIGDNAYGPLGMTTTMEDNPTPPPVPALSGALALSSGGATACAIDGDHSVWCWGRDSHGEVGDHMMQLRSLPTVVASGATALSVGARHACAIVANTVQCWGSNLYGELGAGDRAVASSPMTVSSLATATGLAIGSEHSCGFVGKTLYCWGRNESGELGTGYPKSSSEPAAVSTAVYAVVAVGKFSTCAIDTTMMVRCWGRGDYGQLGNSDGSNHVDPIPVGGLMSVTAISVGSLHACAISNGAVLCWGHNADGELGMIGGDSSAPVVALTGGITSLSAGPHHTCAIDMSHQLYCWGLNDHGQLGDNTTTSRPTPMAVALTATVVSAGTEHTCAISGTDIYCWGSNADGELGTGSVTPMLFPSQAVLGLAGETPIDVHAMHAATCALMQSGNVFCWGDGYLGELGDGMANHDSFVAVHVPLGAKATSLSASGTSACATLLDGSVQCWGADDWGQLAVGLGAAGTLPRPVQGLDCGGS